MEDISVVKIYQKRLSRCVSLIVAARLCTQRNDLDATERTSHLVEQLFRTMGASWPLTRNVQ